MFCFSGSLKTNVVVSALSTLGRSVNPKWDSKINLLHNVSAFLSMMLVILIVIMYKLYPRCDNIFRIAPSFMGLFFIERFLSLKRSTFQSIGTNTSFLLVASPGVVLGLTREEKNCNKRLVVGVQ